MSSKARRKRARLLSQPHGSLKRDLSSHFSAGNHVDRAGRFCNVRSATHGDRRRADTPAFSGGQMRCSKCGTEDIPSKKFCAECGSPLSNRCSNCHSDNAPGAKFCADCGSALGTDVVTEDGKPSAAEADGGVRIASEWQTSETIEGERKTVTALFADIKGSTELMEDLDPEAASAIIDPALKLM